MKSVLLSVVAMATAVLAGAAAAQASAAFDGDWTANFKNPQGTQVSARLVIAGATGTWQGSNINRNNPCVGRETPVAVSADADHELILDIKYSAVLTGCADTRAVLKRSGESSFKGQFAVSGREIELVRK